VAHRLHPLRLGLCKPVAHCALGHATRFRDRVLLPPLFMQLDGLQAALFTPISLRRCFGVPLSSSRPGVSFLSLFPLRSITGSLLCYDAGHENACGAASTL